MFDLSREILEKYQVRKTKKQKLAFIEFMRSYIPDLKVEEGGFGHNRNIIVGDIDRAKVILSAHYDTCAQLPFPNLIMPKNVLFTILYSLLICIPFCAAFFVFDLILLLIFREFTDGYFISYLISLILFLALVFFVFMGGKPNKHTVNDNTSGVITLCEIMGRLTPEQRGEVAFVFFDNEENGMLGSSYFRKIHRNQIINKLLINFDCVSDGDNILVVVNHKARKMFGDRIESVFTSTDQKTVHISKSSTTFYPSDQMGFPVNIAVSALKKNRILGLYMDRIHTKRDTAFDERNIVYLTERVKQFVLTLIS